MSSSASSVRSVGRAIIQMTPEQLAENYLITSKDNANQKGDNDDDKKYNLVAQIDELLQDFYYNEDCKSSTRRNFVLLYV